LKADASGNAVLDMYGAAVDWNHRVPIARGLATGNHVVTVIVTGKKNAASSNSYVQIVGVDVEDSPTTCCAADRRIGLAVYRPPLP
jgi:hypothetical protein